MRGRWIVHGLVIAALALAVVGCTKQEQPTTQRTTPQATPQPAAPKAEAPAPAAPKQEGKVAESAAVQAARKLGTATDKPVVALPSGLQYIDVKEGQGEPAKAGDTVRMQYTGWLESGTEFDSSMRHGGQPFSFPLGAGRVIRGWDEGVAGMKPGGVRKLIIPSDLGYGPRGYPPVIPPNATLIFEVQYLGK